MDAFRGGRGNGEGAGEQRGLLAGLAAATIGEAFAALIRVGQFFAVAENYPDLKANQSFAALQSRISELETGIADRRELYNESVNINNVRIEQFPDVLIARFFAFKAAELLQFSDAEKADVDLKQLFS